MTFKWYSPAREKLAITVKVPSELGWRVTEKGGLVLFIFPPFSLLFPPFSLLHPSHSSLLYPFIFHPSVPEVGDHGEGPVGAGLEGD
jgi:hypothetical protein